MNIDDLIAGFKELEALDRHARFEWNSTVPLGAEKSRSKKAKREEAHIIRLAGCSGEIRSRFQLLLGRASVTVPPPEYEIARNPIQRIIVDIFVEVPELIDNSPFEGNQIGTAKQGRDEWKVLCSTRTIRNAARACIEYLRVVRGREHRPRSGNQAASRQDSRRGNAIDEWKPKQGFIGAKTLYAEYKVPPGTLGGWKKRNPPEDVDTDPRSKECYFPPEWVSRHLQSWDKGRTSGSTKRNKAKR